MFAQGCCMRVRQRIALAMDAWLLAIEIVLITKHPSDVDHSTEIVLITKHPSDCHKSRLAPPPLLAANDDGLYRLMLTLILGALVTDGIFAGDAPWLCLNSIAPEEPLGTACRDLDGELCDRDSWRFGDVSSGMLQELPSFFFRFDFCLGVLGVSGAYCMTSVSKVRTSVRNFLTFFTVSGSSHGPQFMRLS
jgi:hypothetical protein